MNKEEIFKKLDEMLVDKTKISFLNHLVRSYLPTNKIKKVFDRPKGAFKCVITNVELYSIDDILKGVKTDEFKKELFDSLLISLDGEERSLSPIKKLIGDKKVGVTGDKTTTFMSLDCASDFIDWVITKSIKRDKHINWLLNGVNKDSFLSRAKTFDDVSIKNILKSSTKRKSSATYSLGDASEALVKLKEEMEKLEKK